MTNATAEEDFMERQSVRTKKVKTEEMNVAHSYAKGNGTLGTKALG